MDKLDTTLDKLGIGQPGGNHRPSGNRTPKSTDKKGLPLPLPASIPWKPFPVDALPDPVGGLVRAGAKALGCDASYVALPLLAALASAIGATRRIQLKPGWTEPSVLWSAIVGESGTLKSPALSLAVEPLKRLQAWELAQYPELMQQYTRDLALFEADMQAWKRKGRGKGEPPPEKPDEPKIRRYLVNDITIEALADRLQDAPRGLLVACDELGAWLGSFDQYKNGARGGDVSRWLSIHRAESLLVDRKSGNKIIFVPRAAVSVCGSIQPATLRMALGNEHLANGLAARLLVAMPPRTAKQWTDASVDRQLKKDIERLFGRLLALDFIVDEDDQAAPIDIPLSREGRKAWIAFYNSHARELANLTSELAACWSKLEGYAARLALIVHVVRTATDDPTVNREEVDPASIRSGVSLVKWFGNEARRVYETFSESEEDQDRRQLIELIELKGGRITPRELQHSSRRFRGSAEQAEVALKALSEIGLGSWYVEETGGRPASVFRLTVGRNGNTTSSDPEENDTSVTTSVTTDEINAALAESAEGQQADGEFIG